MTGISAVLSIGGTWSPLKLSGLIGWYKGDKGVYNDAGITLATNGQTVQQWNDQSGNGNNLSQSAAGQRPTFNTNVLNGLPGLTFSSGAATHLSSATIALGGTAASAFCVIKGSTPTNFARVFNFIGNGESDDFGNAGSCVFIYFPASTTPSAFRHAVQLSNGTVIDQTFNQIGSIFDGAHNTLYIGGTAQAPVVQTDTFDATGVFTVGALANTNGLDGVVTEIVLTNSAMGMSDIVNLNNYLLTKYGV